MELQVHRLFLQFEPGSAPRIDISTPFELTPGLSLLVAPSGSGKTSLLRLLSGWYEADAAFPAKARVEASYDPLREVEFIGNHQTLLPWYTVRENIALRRPKAPALVDNYWRRVGLPEGALDLFPYELSLGMYKRAELVAALCSSAKLLLLDEFFSSLDPTSRSAALDLINELKTGERTVVISTHTPEAFADVSRIYHFKSRSDGLIVGVELGS
jgi:ABC-type multidrug transport system ATPase subunit